MKCLKDFPLRQEKILLATYTPTFESEQLSVWAENTGKKYVTFSDRRDGYKVDQCSPCAVTHQCHPLGITAECGQIFP